MSNTAAALLLGIILGAGTVLLGFWLGQRRPVRKTATHKPALFTDGGFTRGDYPWDRPGVNFNGPPTHPRPSPPQAPPKRP